MRNKILLAEDSDDYAFLLTRSLQKNGRWHVVFRAADGEETIRYLRGQGQFADRTLFPFPEAILLDVYMPKKSGFDVLEWLGKHPPAPRVIMLSTLDDPAIRKKALQMGAEAFMPKPYEESVISEFTRWLARLFDDGKSG